MKSLQCKDVGMNCEWKTQGQTEDEILKKASEHAKTVHKMDPVPPDVAKRVRGAIRDVR